MTAVAEPAAMPRSRGWLWAVVAGAGAVGGVLAALAILAAAWLSDPEVLMPRGTVTDPWGSDASWLVGIMVVAAPLALLTGTAAACAGCGVALLSRKLGRWGASAAGSILIGLLAWSASAAMSHVMFPPAGTSLLIGLAACAFAFLAGGVLLRLKPATSRSRRAR